MLQDYKTLDGLHNVKESMKYLNKAVNAIDESRYCIYYCFIFPIYISSTLKFSSNVQMCYVIKFSLVEYVSIERISLAVDILSGGLACI